MKKLTQKRLKELLHYDPDTGIFINKITRSSRAIKGNESGSYTDGYLITKIEKEKYSNHQLAWLYMQGYIPKEIDHINTIKDDNRWKNLREISHQLNIRNTGNSKNTTSKIKGICWNKRIKKWFVHIKINYKQNSLGYYKNFDNAVCARLVAEQCLDWEGYNSHSPAYKYVQKMLKQSKKKKLPKIII